MKIHAKTTLVVRREGGGFAATSTSAPATTTRVTARAYEDFGLFTADEEIADDVADLFNHLTGLRPARASSASCSSRRSRCAQRLVEEIRAVADAARDGKKARIRIKVNGLTHPELIDELYAASEAGAKIDLARARRLLPAARRRRAERRTSVCAASLGRFLEHSRVFVFEAPATGAPSTSAAPT